LPGCLFKFCHNLLDLIWRQLWFTSDGVFYASDEHLGIGLHFLLAEVESDVQANAIIVLILVLRGGLRHDLLDSIGAQLWLAGEGVLDACCQHIGINLHFLAAEIGSNLRADAIVNFVLLVLDCSRRFCRNLAGGRGTFSWLSG